MADLVSFEQVRHYWKSNLVPPVCEFDELTTILSFCLLCFLAYIYVRLTVTPVDDLVAHVDGNFVSPIYQPPSVTVEVDRPETALEADATRSDLSRH